MCLSVHLWQTQVSLGLLKRSEVRAWWEDHENYVLCRCNRGRMLVV